MGADSENPATVAYYNEIHRPYAAAHGIELVDVRYTKRDGSTPTLMGRMQASVRSLPIPVRMSNGAPGNRTCTSDFKIKPVAKWLKQQGATKNNKAVGGLGISLDEFQRMRSDSGIAWQVLDYPLITLRLRRDDCARIIADAGLPPAPKSSCWFCPFHRRKTWQEMHDNEPELFAKSVALEAMLNERRQTLSRPSVWLTAFNKPLDQVIAGHQSGMDMDDNCESGYCHT